MAIWKRSATVLTLAAALGPTTAASEPDFENFQWLDVQGGHLEVSGRDFGTGPNVRFFDTFTNDQGATPLAVQSPAWFDRGTFEIDNQTAFSGEGSAVVFDSANNIRNNLKYREPGDDTPHDTRAFQEVYFSYAIKDLGSFPGPGGTDDAFSDISSTKDVWMMLGKRGQGGYHIDDQWVGNDLVAPAQNGSKFLIFGNDTDLGSKKWLPTVANNWAFGEWNQMFFHADVDPDAPRSSGSGFFAFANNNMYDNKELTGNFMSNAEKKPYWDRIKFGPWYREKNSSNVERVHDEIYIATGPNANARIMLGDSQYLDQVTRLHHGAPVDWRGNRIVADFSHVDLDARKNWFVFVSNGDSGLPRNGIPLSAADAPPESDDEGLDDVGPDGAEQRE